MKNALGGQRVCPKDSKEIRGCLRYQSSLPDNTCRHPACWDMDIGSLVRSLYANKPSFLMDKCIPVPSTMTIAHFEARITSMQLCALFHPIDTSPLDHKSLLSIEFSLYHVSRSDKLRSDPIAQPTIPTLGSFSSPYSGAIASPASRFSDTNPIH